VGISPVWELSLAEAAMPLLLGTGFLELPPREAMTMSLHFALAWSF
jgi:hypothetical protein